MTPQPLSHRVVALCWSFQRKLCAGCQDDPVVPCLCCAVARPPLQASQWRVSCYRCACSRWRFVPSVLLFVCEVVSARLPELQKDERYRLYKHRCIHMYLFYFERRYYNYFAMFCENFIIMNICLGFKKKLLVLMMVQLHCKQFH